MKEGDRIVAAQGKESIPSTRVLRQASKITAGKTLSLTIERENEKQELKITAGTGCKSYRPYARGRQIQESALAADRHRQMKRLILSDGILH